MNESIQDDKASIYEISYLIAGVPEERVTGESDIVRGIITAAGATVIAEESPRHEQLAYTIRKKTVSGSYDKYDEAYFGWIKFEVGSDKIEAMKKSVEVVPTVLRMLLISTVRENTYLGKHASAAIAASFGAATFSTRRPAPSAAGDSLAAVAESKEAAAPVAPASVEEMDKSIDDMVKEA